MAKLYLVRRKLETFIGPITVEEMKDAFDRMEFGLQDEVCGHLGKWVTLEDHARLKKYYPDLQPIITPGLMNPWQDGNKNLQKKEKISKPSRKKFVAKQKSVAFLFLLIAFLTLSAAILLILEPDLSFLDLNSNEPVQIEKMESLYRTGDPQKVLRYVEKHQATLVDDILQNGEASVWLPYVRLYAFRKRGVFQFISQKQLRGKEAIFAPLDCSLEEWKNRWRSDAFEWRQIALAKSLPKKQWGRLLAWDPYWISRRGLKGWIEPSNYYGGCILMAHKAFKEVVEDENFLTPFILKEKKAKLIIKVISSRLKWLSYVANGTDYPGDITARRDLDPLSYWTCLEASQTMTELNKCRKSYLIPDNAWKKFEENKKGQSILRLSLSTEGRVSSEIMKALKRYKAKMLKSDNFTRFDMRAELYYLDQIIKFNNKSKALNLVEKKYPNVLMKIGK